MSSPLFEQLAWASTHQGMLTLRRRREPTRDVDVYEVKLDDEYLMSSLFTVAEVELARLGLGVADGVQLDVVVGGLGLGHTARAVLEDDRVRSLTVVEALAPVIEWHEQGLLPEADDLTSDPRVHLCHGDFFAMVRDPSGLGTPDGRADVVLVDIDHTPRHVLHPSHEPFYTVAGLRRLAGHLAADGVFALWSDDPPDEPFLAALDDVFDAVRAEVVRFPNFHTGGESANTVYVARRPQGGVAGRRDAGPRTHT